MDNSALRAYLPQLKENATQVDSLHRDLTELVFGGATDWADLDDGWLAQQLATRLGPGQAEQLGSALAGPDAGLAYLTDVLVPAWKAGPAAPEAGPAVSDGDAASGLTGTDNSANWAVSRIPGTLYFAHDGDDYRYCDHEHAPADEWHTLDERMKAAADAAREWGAAWCTLAGEDPRYEGSFVYAVDRFGPWLPQAEVERLLTTTPAAADAEAQQWADVWTSQQDGQWRFGLTADGPFTYEDGAAAQRDKAILDDVTATLLDQYPNADLGYVRATAAQFVAQTA